MLPPLATSGTWKADGDFRPEAGAAQLSEPSLTQDPKYPRQCVTAASTTSAFP